MHVFMNHTDFLANRAVSRWSLQTTFCERRGKECNLQKKHMESTSGLNNLHGNTHNLKDISRNRLCIMVFRIFSIYMKIHINFALLIS